MAQTILHLCDKCLKKDIETPVTEHIAVPVMFNAKPFYLDLCEDDYKKWYEPFRDMVYEVGYRDKAREVLSPPKAGKAGPASQYPRSCDHCLHTSTTSSGHGYHMKARHPEYCLHCEESGCDGIASTEHGMATHMAVKHGKGAADATSGS